MSGFENLVEELAEMRKALSDEKKDDKKIAAAADGDMDDDGEPDVEDVPDDYDDDDYDYDDDDDDDDEMKKSFTVTLENGEEVEAFNGEWILKSMQDRMDEIESTLDRSGKDGADAITETTQLIKSLIADNKRINAKIDALMASGSGRKSTLNIHERRTVGEFPDSPNPQQIMAKALEAQRQGRLSGADIARLDSYFGRGQTPPETLLAKIGG